MFSKRLIESLKLHEGFRAKAYKDSVGVLTIGYGTNLETLRVDKGLAEELLIGHLNEAERLLMLEDGYVQADPIRRDVLLEMCYNLGYTRLKEFKKMWTAINCGNYREASKEMLDSKWAKQVGMRAQTLARRMATGTWEQP